jgi:hypothetical protein
MADATRKVNGFSPSDPQRGLGDNGGPPLQKLTSKKKIERIKEVLDMEKLSAAQKCVGIAIVCEADADWITPELSTADLQRYASVKDRETVYRATRQLDERKVANAVKTEGRANKYVVLPSEAIDAALDEIEASHPTGTVQPDPTGPTKPDGYGGAEPVGLEPTTPVRSNPTGRVEPVGLEPTGVPQDAGTRAPTCARNEPPSGVNNLSQASKLADGLSPVVGELAGLNGAADPMLKDILGWLGSGGESNARQWLSTFIVMHGQEIVKESYLKLKTDILSGGLISRPLQTWSTIATRLKREPAKATRPEKGISRLKEKFLRGV